MNNCLLLIEDDDLDASMLEMALKKAAPQLNFRRAPDGIAGLKLLETERPDMVLLDLSMPGLSGFDVLDSIRNDEKLSNTPVIICSNSDAESDVLLSYSKRANAYVVKPDSGAGYHSLAEALTRFWFEEAQLASTP